jgi:hypothetical protein
MQNIQANGPRNRARLVSGQTTMAGSGKAKSIAHRIDHTVAINATTRMIRTPFTPVTIAGLGDTPASIVASRRCSFNIARVNGPFISTCYDLKRAWIRPILSPYLPSCV